MRLIDGDALMELYADKLTVVAERYSPDSSECGILSGAMKLLEIQPTIEERKSGKWIDKGIIPNYPEEGFNIFHLLVCDQCGCMHRTTVWCVNGKYINANFCPNCGAVMRGEEHGQTD